MPLSWLYVRYKRWYSFTTEQAWTPWDSPRLQQAKAISPMTLKTFTDDGYHSVPIHPEDLHLTTSLTPCGRYRYKMVAQELGLLWRLCKEIWHREKSDLWRSSLHHSETSQLPPNWVTSDPGLDCSTKWVKLTEIMTPFKPQLSPKSKFVWTSELESAFQSSKNLIIDGIEKGVKIFNMTKLTCLRPTRPSRHRIVPMSEALRLHLNHVNCCKDWWKITLVGLRFLKSTKSCYAPVEGETLAITKPSHWNATTTSWL